MPKGCRPVAGRWPCGCRPVAGRWPARCRPVGGAGPCRPAAGRLPGNKNCILCRQSLCGGTSLDWRCGESRQGSVGWRCHSHHRLGSSLGAPHGAQLRAQWIQRSEEPELEWKTYVWLWQFHTQPVRVDCRLQDRSWSWGPSIQIHALDSGEGPVLFSIASLRALGAVIDFAEDLVCFRSLYDKKVIQLERSCTGHQLLPLTQDWYEDSKTSDRSIPSLREYI